MRERKIKFPNKLVWPEVVIPLITFDAVHSALINKMMVSLFLYQLFFKVRIVFAPVGTTYNNLCNPTSLNYLFAFPAHFDSFMTSQIYHMCYVYLKCS